MLKPELIAAITGMVIVALLGIAFQIVVAQNQDTTKFEKSLHLWFGNLGILFFVFLSGLVIAIVKFAPKALFEVRSLIKDTKATLLQVRELTAAIQALTTNIKDTTKISDLVHSAVNLASQGARALANSPR